MSQEQLKIGDSVVLKSGSPLMTIESIGNYGGVEKARCIWFVNGDAKSELFPLAGLERED